MPSEKEIEEAIKVANTMKSNIWEFPKEPSSELGRLLVMMAEAYLSMKSERDKYKAIVEADTKALNAVDDLMNQSIGVVGLHLNGDIANWNDIRTGGYFEDWLIDFDSALALREKES